MSSKLAGLSIRVSFSPLMPHFRGLRDGVEYKFLDRIQHRHQLRNRK